MNKSHQIRRAQFENMIWILKFQKIINNILRE